jgi:hypothetical protein
MVAQEMANHILAQIPSNLFRAFIPESDAPVWVNNIDAGFERV